MNNEVRRKKPTVASVRSDKVAEQPKTSPKISSGEAARRSQQLWRRWARNEFAGGPPSQILAATAGAIRAIELRQDQTQAVASAARTLANAWKPPEGYSPIGDISSTEEQWQRWAEAEIGGPLSRILIATAAAIRMIELRSDQAHAIQAARDTADAWGVSEAPSRSNSAARITPDSSQLEAPPGVIRGQVVGLVKRAVPVARSENQGTIPGESWSFSLHRKGTAPNGRPCLPVPIQLLGKRIDGVLEEGDIVEFKGEAPASTVVEPRSLHNVSKNCAITVRKDGESLGARVWLSVRLVFTVLVVALILSAFVFAISGHLK